MGHSSQGIVKDQKGEEQPADKQRAQTAHKTASKASVSKEGTRDPKTLRRQQDARIRHRAGRQGRWDDGIKVAVAALFAEQRRRPATRSAPS